MSLLIPSDRTTNPHSITGCPESYLLSSLLMPYKQYIQLEENVIDPDYNTHKGRGLLASQDIPNGTIIIQETAFVWQMDNTQELRWRNDIFASNTNTNTNSQETSSSPSTSSSINTTIADALLFQMAPYAYTKDILMRIRLRPVTEKEVIEATMKANSFRVTQQRNTNNDNDNQSIPDEEGRALFSVICLTNHSCSPNAKVYQVTTSDCTLTNNSPPQYILESRSIITKHEEITISYLPRSWDKQKRQQYIQETWNFECTCTRCSLPWDDTYAAKCSHCSDGYIYGGALNCTVCGEAMEEDRMEQFLGGTDIINPYTQQKSTLPNPLDTILSSPLSIDKLVKELINHSLLIAHDIRLFTALNSLLPILTEELQNTENKESEIYPIYEESYQLLLQGIVQGALNSAYTSPEDLGIEIDTE